MGRGWWESKGGWVGGGGGPGMDEYGVVGVQGVGM